MKSLFSICLTILTLNIFAQAPENFDIASFTALKTWKKETKTNVVTYTKTNNNTGGYCIIAVYKSIASLGTIDKDYNSEWKELVTDRFMVNGNPETATEKKSDGWQVKAGSSLIKTDNGDAVAILSVFSDGAVSMSVLTLLNKEEYLADADNFIASVKLKKTQPGTKPAVQEPGQPPTSAPGGKYQFTTSNFDDGWVSTVQNEYVLVEKENNAVYLLYHVPYNASQFSGTGVRDAEYYWDNYLIKYFHTKSKQYNDGGSIALKPPYMEGYATDKRTGRACFIGMYLLIVPNAVSLVIGTAPDENAFRKLYPKSNDPFLSDLAAMERYNKFAVASGDIIGKWQDGNTQTAHWYYESPSGYQGYAGMTLAATSTTYLFNSNGSYTSIHNGATGSVGNMSTFQQEYKGKYTVTNWSITATNRWQGKTARFEVYFSAVRGGRILHLNDAGTKYSLVKTN
jgi:hypothetical protein